MIRNAHFYMPLVIFTEEAKTYEKIIYENNLFNIFIVSSLAKNSRKYGVYEICAFCNKGKHMMKRINVWNDKFLKNITFPSSFKGSFFGATLKVAMVDKALPPFFYKRKDKYGGEVSDGFRLQVMQFFKEKYNCTLNIVHPPDNVIGSLVNGSWTGYSKLLQEGKVDLTSTSGLFWIKSKHFKYIPMAIQMFHFYVISKKPGFVPPWQATFRTFSFSVWITIGIAYFAISITFYIIKRNSADDTFASLTTTNGLSESFFKMWQILAWDSFYVTSPNLSIIMSVGAWLLLSFFLVNTYTSILFSHMMTPLYDGKPVDSIQDLKDSNLKWRSEPTTASGRMLDFDPILKYRKNSAKATPESAFAELGETAVIGRKETAEAIANLYLIDSDGKHNAYVSKHSLYYILVSLYFGDTIPYSDDFVYFSIQMYETGVTYKFVDDGIDYLALKGVTRMKQEGKGKGETLEKKLKLEHVAGAFFVLFGGVSAGTISLILEMLIKRKVSPK